MRRSSFPAPVALLVFLVMAALPSWSQFRCGTVPTPDQIKYMDETREARQNFDASALRAGTRWIPISFHIVKDDAGNGGVDPNILPALLGRLNRAFEPANVQFFQCGKHELILSTTYHHLSVGGTASNMLDEDALLGLQHDVPNTMNIYFVNQIDYSGGYYDGLTQFPGGGNRMRLKSGVATAQGLIEHETGHFFGLYHTHQNAGNPTLGECANGSNCATTGDQVCDTPADPDLSLSALSCVYNGSGGNDPCGQPYNPDPSNFMSYSPYGCQTKFTSGQYNRIAYGAMVDRGELNCINDDFKPCIGWNTMFPYYHNFDGGGFLTWENSNLDNFDWSVGTTGPNAPATGPSTPASGTHFAYIEADGNNPNKIAILDIPCMDLTYTKSPQLAFSYHMVGSDIGTLKLECSTDGGINWISLFYKKGEQPSGWHNETINLSQYVSQTLFNLRFVATTSIGTLGDIAIDNFSITSNLCNFNSIMMHFNSNCNYQNSNVAYVVAAPGGSTYQWAKGTSPNTVIGTLPAVTNQNPGPYQVTVTYGGCAQTLGTYIEQKNFRITTLVTQPSPVVPTGTVMVNMADGNTPYASIEWWGPVNGSSTSITNSLYTISGLPPGTYRIQVKDASNCLAGTSVTITAQPNCVCRGLLTVGTMQSFESGLGNWAYCPSVFPALNPWGVGTGDMAPVNTTGPTAFTAPNAPNCAYDGLRYAYAVNSANPGRGAKLISPCLDFTGVANPCVTFYYHNFRSTGPIGSFKLYLKDNQGFQSMIPVWSGSNASSDSWIPAKADLSIAGNTNGRYQLVFYSIPISGQSGDVAIDKVEIIDCSTPGFSASLTTSGPSCTASGSATVNATCTGALTYAWSDGPTTPTRNNLTPYTVYAVTVTCAGANSERVLYVYPVPNAMTPSAVATESMYAGQNNGSVHAVPGGGNAPYSYTWSGPGGFTGTSQDITNLAPGTYFVTITDALGCTGAAQGTVLEGGCPNLVSGNGYNESWENVFGSWKNPQGEAASHFDWVIGSGVSPGTQSGPSSAADGTYYAYLNSNPGPPQDVPNGAEAHLVSHCIDLRRATAATFNFDYNATVTVTPPGGMGSLYLDVTTNQGVTWTNMQTVLTGGNSNPGWISASQSLTAYVGKVIQLRFRGIMGSDNQSDMALDHPRIVGTFFKSNPTAETGALDGVVLYPVPTQDRVNVDFYSSQQQAMRCEVIDIAGRSVQAWESGIVEGNNHLDFSTKDYPAGVYLLRMTVSGTRKVERFMVIR